MTEDPAGGPRPSAAENLAAAVRAVAGEASAPEPPPKNEGPHLLSRRNLTLILVALALTALILLAGDLVSADWMSTFAKVLTTVLGTALVAYTDQIRRRLLEFADRPASPWLAAIVLLLLSVPRLLPIEIPVIVDRDSSLTIDSLPARFSPASTSLYPGTQTRYVTLHGLRRHSFTLRTRGTTFVPEVRFRLSPTELLWLKLRARSAWPDSTSLVIPPLLLTSIEKELGVADLTIVGVLPPLYRSWIADSVDVRSTGDTTTIWLPLGKQPAPEIPPLPIGRYLIRLSTEPAARLCDLSAAHAVVWPCDTLPSRARP